MATSSAQDTQQRTISLESILAARQRVYQAAVRTPLVRFYYDDAPAEIYLKLESLQPIGSFKIRGAYNAISLLSPQNRARGVWTVSAGNAAQGVALAARILGVGCEVLVMDTAPAAKLDAIKRLGASIRQASMDECWTAVTERKHPAFQGVFVHPFDDDDFIAGNATAGLEILEDLPDVTAIVAGFGGGGLSCGIASAMAALKPEGLCRRTGNRRAPSPVVPQRFRSEVSGLENKFCRRLRRQVRFAQYVDACQPAASRLDCYVAGGDAPRHVTGRRPQPPDLRRCSRLRSRRRTHRQSWQRQNRLRRQRRKHRSQQIRRAGDGSGLTVRNAVEYGGRAALQRRVTDSTIEFKPRSGEKNAAQGASPGLSAC